MSSLGLSYRKQMNSAVLVNEDQIRQPLDLNLLQVHIKLEVLTWTRLHLSRSAAQQPFFLSVTAGSRSIWMTITI